MTPEIKAFLSCIYFEALFLEESFGIQSIALQGIMGTGALLFKKEVYTLVMEIMEKNPDFIDCNILLHSSYVRINGRVCDYCDYYKLREKISEFLEKREDLDWNHFVVNANSADALSINIKVNTNNQHLLLLMLKRLNKAPEEKQQSLWPVDLMNFTTIKEESKDPKE